MSFFKITWKKIVFTIILLGLFLITGFICSPAYADPIGMISSCWKPVESIFFEPTFIAFHYPWLILFYFILFYLLVCLINYLLNKVKYKR
ncbi:MAG: hypothetical protein AABW89_02560 [Nanoarchaeota archaeon]